MKTRDSVATSSPSQMFVVLSLVWFSCWTDVASALPDEASQPTYVYVDDTRSTYQSSNRLEQLPSVGSHQYGDINSRLYALAYVQRQQQQEQQQQQPSYVSAGLASVDAAPLGVSNFGYQSLTSSYQGSVGSTGRSSEDSNYETANEEDNVVQSSATQHTEEKYNSDDDAEADADNEGAETQAQLDDGDENGGNEGTSVGSADNEDDNEQEAGPVAKSGYSRRRKRTKSLKPKVIIVKKIIPVSTTTFAYIVGK